MLYAWIMWWWLVDAAEELVQGGSDSGLPEFLLRARESVRLPCLLGSVSSD